MNAKKSLKSKEIKDTTKISNKFKLMNKTQGINSIVKIFLYRHVN